MKHFIFDFNRDKGLVSSFLESRCKAHNSEIKSEAWFYWKFKENPYGESILACATENDQIVGCVAYGIQFFSFKGSTIKGAVSFENFVHPEFQRQGIFYRLLKLAESEVKNRSVEFMVNFPSSISLPGFLKNNWTPMEIAEYWVRGWSFFSIPANLISLRKGFKPNPPNVDKFKSPTNIFEAQHDELTNMVSLEFVKWRFFSYPIAEYEVFESDEFYAIGRVGYRGTAKELQILFLNVKNNSSFRLLDFLDVCKSQCSYDIISFAISHSNAIRKQLKRSWFLKVPNKTIVCYKILTEEYISEADIKNISFYSVIYHTY